MLGFMLFLLNIRNLVIFPCRSAVSGQNIVSCGAKAAPEHCGTREEQVKWEQKKEKYMKNSKVEGKVEGGLPASHKNPGPLPGALFETCAKPPQKWNGNTQPMVQANM